MICNLIFPDKPLPPTPSTTGGIGCGLEEGVVYKEACHLNEFGSLCWVQLLAEVEAALLCAQSWFDYCVHGVCRLEPKVGSLSLLPLASFAGCPVSLRDLLPPVSSCLLAPHSGPLFSISKIFIEHLLWARHLLGAGDRLMNKTKQDLCPCESYVLVR